MSSKVILTTLDWLTAAEDSGLEQLKPVLSSLNRSGVVVVGWTACDRAELEPIRAALSWSAPFIVESGSAIFTPVDHNPFATPLGEQEGAYFVEALGCPYVQARAGLRVLANLISHPLKGYGDFTVPQLERFLKVTEDVAHRAKAREFSEPFMTPKAVDSETLVSAAKEIGFGVILRDQKDNRFSELVGAGVSLERAITLIVGAYKDRNADASISIVASREVMNSFSFGEGVASHWEMVGVDSFESWVNALR